MAESGPVLAVDIGGTKMAAGVTEPGGRLITWAQIPTLRDIDGEQLWRNLEDLVLGVLEDAKVSDPAELSGIGCGCGGPMEWPSGRVSPLNIPAWRLFPLRERLADKFGTGGGPVRVHNDAICMAAGEHWRGAGRGRKNVLGMVVSTGVGGGPDPGRSPDRRRLRQRRAHRSRGRLPATGRPARAAGAAAWRRSPEVRRSRNGRRRTAGVPISQA